MYRYGSSDYLVSKSEFEELEELIEEGESVLFVKKLKEMGFSTSD